MIIKNCPHCGGTAQLQTTAPDGYGPGISRIVCGTCGAKSGLPAGSLLWRCAYDGLTDAQGIKAHDDEVVRLWNMRYE